MSWLRVSSIAHFFQKEVESEILATDVVLSGNMGGAGERSGVGCRRGGENKPSAPTGPCYKKNLNPNIASLKKGLPKEGVLQVEAGGSPSLSQKTSPPRG